MNDNERYRLYEVADTLLGACGAMLSGSKTAAPERQVVWNGNVLVGTEKVWYGDISVVEKADELQQLANHADDIVSVMREMDARFLKDGEKPDLKRAVIQFVPGSTGQGILPS